MNADQLKKVAHDLLVAHPSRGVKPAALTQVLESLEVESYENGDLLCTEGDPGDSMYFLLYGAIRVTRKDQNGQDRELVTMSAPALIGHMALVDNSPRSATCRASGTTQVAPLDRRLYHTILSEPSARGTARRMLLTSLTRQLETATGKLRKLIAGEEDPQNNAGATGHSGQDETERELMKISGALNGWGSDLMKQADEMEVVYDENQKAAERARQIRK